MKKEIIGDATLYLGDALEILPTLDKVDCVVTDPPYGKTACKWDSVIPLEPMWHCLKRIISETGPIVLMSSQPFTTTLISSNMEMFNYEVIYEKTNAKGFLSAKHKPLTAHENILVFGKGKTYNPQKWTIPEYLRTKRKSATRHTTGEVYGGGEIVRWDDDGSRYPTSVIGFSNRVGRQENYHPTQKPVLLMEYLIQTYSNPGDVILDFTMGSGTTGLACMNLKRKFIGVEIEEKYFNIAVERIPNAQRQQALF